MKVIRHMARVKLRDGVPSNELLYRCGLTDVLKEIRLPRWRWYGHVASRRSTEALGRVFNMEVDERRLAEKRKVTCIKFEDPDLRKINVTKEDALDCRSRQQIIQPHDRDKMDLKGKVK